MFQKKYLRLELQEKIREFMDESEYSSLEEAEEWTKRKIKANIISFDKIE